MCIFFPFFYFEGGFYFQGGWILDPGSGVVWGRGGRNKSRRGEGRRRQAGPTLGANCPSKCSALIFGFVSSLSLSLSRVRLRCRVPLLEYKTTDDASKSPPILPKPSLASTRSSCSSVHLSTELVYGILFIREILFSLLKIPPRLEIEIRIKIRLKVSSPRVKIGPDSSETEPCFDTFLVLLRSFIDRARIWDFIYSRNLILAFKNSPSTGNWD